jgi:hypothetical protein
MRNIGTLGAILCLTVLTSPAAAGLTPDDPGTLATSSSACIPEVHGEVTTSSADCLDALNDCHGEVAVGCDHKHSCRMEYRENDDGEKEWVEVCDTSYCTLYVRVAECVVGPVNPILIP